MTRTIGTLAAVAVIIAFVARAGAQPAGVRKDIEATNEKFMAAFQKADAAGMAALYTTDGETFPPNGDVIRGRDAIQEMWQSVAASGVSSAKLVTREVESAGNLAWESGSYEMFGKDGASLDRGKYIVVWKRQQGRWLIHRDIWNSSVPAKP
ncbi:MAG TPA: SgcJ/EcaC family oxidoreductase [Vicinamibacterales bacterium]|nr:SgcJ/EcaC family oxidoreductase [Vicinamibacterales bacterium]